MFVYLYSTFKTTDVDQSAAHMDIGISKVMLLGDFNIYVFCASKQYSAGFFWSNTYPWSYP